MLWQINKINKMGDGAAAPGYTARERRTRALPARGRRELGRKINRLGRSSAGPCAPGAAPVS